MVAHDLDQKKLKLADLLQEFFVLRDTCRNHEHPEFTEAMDESRIYIVSSEAQAQIREDFLAQLDKQMAETGDEILDIDVFPLDSLALPFESTYLAVQSPLPPWGTEPEDETTICGFCVSDVGGERFAYAFIIEDQDIVIQRIWQDGEWSPYRPGACLWLYFFLHDIYERKLDITEKARKPITIRSTKKGSTRTQRRMPPPYYTVEARTDLARDNASKSQPKEWTYRWDSSAHERVLVRRGPLPLADESRPHPRPLYRSLRRARS